MLFRSFLLPIAVVVSFLTPVYSAEPAYTVADLGTLGGSQATAIAINASGQVAGNSLLNDNVAEHPFLWSAGRIADLGTLGGTVGEAFGVNGPGQVAGTAHIAGNAAFHAFLSSGGAMHDLGVLPGSKDSVGSSINDSGQITGQGSFNGNSHAFLLTPLGPSPTPEPGVWGLLAAGATLGLTLRRRHRCQK